VSFHVSLPSESEVQIGIYDDTKHHCPRRAAFVSAVCTAATEFHLCVYCQAALLIYVVKSVRVRQMAVPPRDKKFQ
jgi:hypothetical protein